MARTVREFPGDSAVLRIVGILLGGASVTKGHAPGVVALLSEQGGFNTVL